MDGQLAGHRLVRLSPLLRAYQGNNDIETTYWKSLEVNA